MNIALFGCKSTTKWMLDELKEKIKINNLITIDEDIARKNIVADYYDFWNELHEQNFNRGVIDDNFIVYYYALDYSLKTNTDFNTIKNMKIDLAFCIGWQRLIPKEILDIIPLGVYGMHGSAMGLPKGRGRSPLNWSIIEGREKFYTSLFRYDAGVDSGGIVDTEMFCIYPNDTCETLHFKNMIAMRNLILKNISLIKISLIEPLKQNDNIEPTYYPKRTPEASCINWRLSIDEVERFIRAVTKPFNGAFTFIDDYVLTIYRTNIFSRKQSKIENDAPYKPFISEVFPNGKFLIQFEEGELIVHEYDYTATIEIGSTFTDGNINVPTYEINKDGFYDMPLKKG